MTLFLLLALLLGAGEAGAEVTDVPIHSDGKCHKHNNVWEPVNGHCLNMVTAEEIWIDQLRKPDPCLTTMAAAMRDAEWFLTKPLKREGAYTLPNIDWPGMEKEIHAKAQAMWQQWTAAKACWRTP